VDVSTSKRKLSFYLTQPGVPTSGSSSSPASQRGLSFVEYAASSGTTSSILNRSDASIQWSEATKVAYGSATPPSTTARTIAAGILCFDYRFITREGVVTANPSDVQDIAAVRVSIAMADENSYADLRQSGKLQGLCNALASQVAADTTPSGKVKWDAMFDDHSFTSNYSRRILAGLRCFERVIPVNVELNGL
jgi:hypothetical protein